MFSVYAIASIDKKYVYVGLSSNIEERIERHNKGHEKTTRPYAPYVLIYSENVPYRIQARKREKYLKSRTGKRQLYKILESKFPQLQQYLK